MIEIDYTNVFVWFIVFAIVGGLLRRMWALLWGFSVASSLAGIHLAAIQVIQYSTMCFVAAAMFAVVGIPFLVRDYKISKAEDARNKAEQDNRLSQIEHVSLIVPNSKPKND